MDVLAIDVGLKNLAVCVMSCREAGVFTSYDIKYWDVINTLEKENVCAGVTKKGLTCGKKASYRYSDAGNIVFSCKPHVPKNVRSIKIPVKKVKDFQLQTIAEIVLAKVDCLLQDISFATVSKIVIELQPKINNKMKFVSHILYGKLVDCIAKQHLKTQVRFVRAAKKLKAYTGPAIPCHLKGAYATRKYLAIKHTQWFLRERFAQHASEKWSQFLDQSSKKDDLADCFLMCINELG